MHENIVRIKAVANALKNLNQEYVFVGGATVSLYATNLAAAASVRPTDDVDIVVELAASKDYAIIEERLRALGFANDVESGVICRYRLNGLIVDIMPTDPAIIGFANKWYPEGFANAIDYQIDEDMVVRIFSPPYFLASKWEAHLSRGGDDLRMSRDFEDIVYVLEHCEDLEEQISSAPESVKAYLRTAWKDIIDSPEFEEGLYAHMDMRGDDPSFIIFSLKAALDLKIRTN